MKIGKNLIYLFCLLLLASCLSDDSPLGLDSDQKIDTNQTFAAKNTVEVTTVSGNCLIKVGDDDSIYVQVEYAFDPPEAFTPTFREEANRLILKENISGSTSGESRWTITLPRETNVAFTSASGNFEIGGTKKSVSATTASGNITARKTNGNVSATSASGNFNAETITGNLAVSTASGNVYVDSVSGNISFVTASGNVDIINTWGAITANTASGNIDIAAANGSLQINAASGSIDVRDVVIADASSFNTASGNVHVRLAASAEHNLTLNTASGNTILDYNGNPVVGHFEMSARVSDGRIVSPFAFDMEETYVQSGQTYWRKSFTRTANTPKITIGTASGTAELRE